MSWTWPSHPGISGLTPGWNTKTLPATQLKRKGREKKKTKNKKTIRQIPRTNGKANLYRQITQRSIHIHTHNKRKEKKYIYTYI